VRSVSERVRLLKIAVFWVVAPCSLVEVYQRFRGPCCLHHQGDALKKTAIFILTAVRTSNHTWFVYCYNIHIGLYPRHINIHIGLYPRHIKLTSLFDVLCGPTQLSNYIGCAAPNVTVLINVKFQMHVSYLCTAVLYLN
jgi:hypothetical protein